ncbi:MAG: PAS domain S-box protein [Burkholderiales bacterium]|nr:PAS domain S-box protein [Burkholderiales bacterium]
MAAERPQSTTLGRTGFLAASWLALFVGLIVVAATLGLWRALIAEERADTERAVALNLDSVRNEISSRMESRIFALVRMARRWEMRGGPPREEWESDAKLYLSHYTGYLAIARIGPEFELGWLVAQDASRSMPGEDFVGGRQREALQAARLRREVVLSHGAGSTAGERLLLINVPVFQGEAFNGFIVGMVKVQPMIAAILTPSIASGYAIAVSNDGTEIYRRDSEATQAARESGQETSIGLYGVTWRVNVWPREELTESRSPLARAVLLGGLSLAFLVALTVHFAQVARLRAREAESANRELKHVIVEHEQTNERLRKLSRAVEQSPSMVLITDRHGAIEYVNPKFTQVTGYTVDQVAGENPRLLKSGETDTAAYDQLWQTITAGGEWRGVLHDRKKNGELFWVHSAISPIRDSRDRITHYLAEMEDITERKHLEQQVVERNREIAKSQAFAAMGRASSMIAHDLRNPLSSIKMGLQMLSKKPPPDWAEAERELLQIAQEQVHYMEEVLSDLLSYSLPDALKPEWLNVDKLLDSAVMLAQREIEEHKVRVTTHYQPGLPVLYGDANKLRQAFINLIGNGAQATAGVEKVRPALVIDARLRLPAEDRPSIQVEICDNGCGVAPEYLDKVFEPFFTTRAQGTGLGLPIAKRIIDQHEGSISLQPEPPGGTRVTVVLPLAPAAGRA